MASNGSPVALPESHLAALIEDALVAADGSSRASARATRERGFVAALIYGWAVGASSSRDLAARAQIDPGLQFLFRGAVPEFADIRSFRNGRANDIEVACAKALAICRIAGMLRLGQIRLDRLPRARTERAAPQGFSADDFRAVARELLTDSFVADQRDDKDFGEDWPAHLPVGLSAHANRQRSFVSAAATPAPRARHLNSALPGRSWMRRSGLASMIGGFALLLAGLLLVRWVSALGAPPVAGASASRPPVSVPGGFMAIAPTSVLAQTPVGDDLGEARHEAMRLAGIALEDDDLIGARDWYFLAAQAEPEDREAQRRLLMIEIALGVDDRRGGWEAAVDELTELLDLAPDSPTVLRAYVTGLVGAGREALAVGDVSRAVDLCGEATRWFPLRSDAQACLARALPRPTRVVAPTVQPTAARAIVPAARPTATARLVTTPLPAPSLSRSEAEPTPTLVPTELPPTGLPPSTATRTTVSPTAAPTAAASPTLARPTATLRTAGSPTTVPLTVVPPTALPPTVEAPIAVPPTTLPPAVEPLTTVASTPEPPSAVPPIAPPTLEPSPTFSGP